MLRSSRRHLPKACQIADQTFEIYESHPSDLSFLKKKLGLNLRREIVFLTGGDQPVHHRSTKAGMRAPCTLSRQSYPDRRMRNRIKFTEDIVIHNSIFELAVMDVIGGTKKMFTTPKMCRLLK